MDNKDFSKMLANAISYIEYDMSKKEQMYYYA